MATRTALWGQESTLGQHPAHQDDTRKFYHMKKFTVVSKFVATNGNTLLKLVNTTEQSTPLGVVKSKHTRYVWLASTPLAIDAEVELDPATYTEERRDVDIPNVGKRTLTYLWFK